MTLIDLLILLIIAAICGAIGRAIAGGTQGGCLVSIAVGFIGALIGSAIARKLHLPEPFLVRVGGQPFPMLWSIVGGAVVVAVLHLISGRR
jgi:uncharacterized membrane protein YeaQ/YmgE (transglycosylase-associated protein family)